MRLSALPQARDFFFLASAFLEALSCVGVCVCLSVCLCSCVQHVLWLWRLGVCCGACFYLFIKKKKFRVCSMYFDFGDLEFVVVQGWRGLQEQKRPTKRPPTGQKRPTTRPTIGQKRPTNIEYCVQLLTASVGPPWCIRCGAGWDKRWLEEGCVRRAQGPKETYKDASYRAKETY